jgi:hypothetical protein
MQYTVTCAIKYHKIYLYGNCEQELYTLHNKCFYMSICLHKGFVLWNARLQQTRFICIVKAQKPQKSAIEQSPGSAIVCMHSWLLSQPELTPNFSFVKVQ